LLFFFVTFTNFFTLFDIVQTLSIFQQFWGFFHSQFFLFPQAKWKEARGKEVKNKVLLIFFKQKVNITSKIFCFHQKLLGQPCGQHFLQLLDSPQRRKQELISVQKPTGH